MIRRDFFHLSALKDPTYRLMLVQQVVAEWRRSMPDYERGECRAVSVTVAEGSQTFCLGCVPAEAFDHDLELEPIFETSLICYSPRCCACEALHDYIACEDPTCSECGCFECICEKYADSAYDTAHLEP